MSMVENFGVFFDLFKFQFSYMTLAWILCIVLNNGSYVDFAWPSGFFIMTLQFLFSDYAGWVPRKMIIATPLLFCGLRFMVGWTFGRKHYKHEDTRWGLWREKWLNGEGLFGVKSVAFNFFFFYHAQSLTNAFVVSFPLYLLFNNKDSHYHCLEIIGFLVFLLSFYLENVADFQLKNFKKDKENRGKVMKSGLWRYSRHPNYFFEWMIWISYTLMSIPSIRHIWQYFYLLLVPLVTYYFLVYFTGVPMAEKQSLKRRGQEYADYQAQTNMFFLGFPKTKQN